MYLTSEYQYLGRSNDVPSHDDWYSYYILLYARAIKNIATGSYTVYVKQRIACEIDRHFYGWTSSADISVEGTSIVNWEWQKVPNAAWSEEALTEDGVTYPMWTDLREGSISIDVGYGTEKTINITSRWELVGEFDQGYLPVSYWRANANATVVLPMLAEASQPSVSADRVSLGSKLSIRTNSLPDAKLTHTLSYKFGNRTGTIANNVTNAYDWYPDIDLADQIPNTVEGTCIIYCETFAENASIGIRQITVALLVPESVVPYVSATIKDSTKAYDLLDVYVQNVSTLDISVNAAGAYGSTIAEVYKSLDGKSYTEGILKTAGTLSLVITAVDTRGRSKSVSYPIEVAEYVAPTLTLSASRCTDDGTADDNGAYAIITVNGFVQPVNNNNIANLVVNWSTGSESLEPAVGDIFWQKIIPADVNSTKIITAALNDQLYRATRSMVLSTGYATLDLLAGGEGLSLGKAATMKGFDCAMKAYFRSGLYSVKSDGTIDTVSLFDRVAALETQLLNLSSAIIS